MTTIAIVSTVFAGLAIVASLLSAHGYQRQSERVEAEAKERIGYYKSMIFKINEQLRLIRKAVKSDTDSEFEVKTAPEGVYVIMKRDVYRIVIVFIPYACVHGDVDKAYVMREANSLKMALESAAGVAKRQRYGY